MPVPDDHLCRYDRPRNSFDLAEIPVPRPAIDGATTGNNGSPRLFFCLGTGRCGTQSLAGLLATMAPAVLCTHETQQPDLRVLFWDPDEPCVRKSSRLFCCATLCCTAVGLFDAFVRGAGVWQLRAGNWRFLLVERRSLLEGHG